MYRNYMKECCQVKETSAMCLEEKGEAEERVYSIMWAAIVSEHELQDPLVKYGWKFGEGDADFISLKHVILFFQ